MNERDALSVTSRERLRMEIAAQTEQFLRRGGVEHLHIANLAVRPIVRADAARQRQSVVASLARDVRAGNELERFTISLPQN